eukprot:scaffold16996_cov101-Isochrysis_galbana.AAC.3
MWRCRPSCLGACRCTAAGRGPRQPHGRPAQPPLARRPAADASRPAPPLRPLPSAAPMPAPTGGPAPRRGAWQRPSLAWAAREQC